MRLALRRLNGSPPAGAAGAAGSPPPNGSPPAGAAGAPSTERVASGWCGWRSAAKRVTSGRCSRRGWFSSTERIAARWCCRCSAPERVASGGRCRSCPAERIACAGGGRGGLGCGFCGDFGFPDALGPTRRTDRLRQRLWGSRRADPQQPWQKRPAAGRTRPAPQRRGFLHNAVSHRRLPSDDAPEPRSCEFSRSESARRLEFVPATVRLGIHLRHRSLPIRPPFL